MSIHPSLAISEKDKKPRSVLKRSERIRSMMEKGKWKEGSSVFGLPKIKTVRIKIKKEKAEKAVEETAAGAAPAAGEAKAAAPAKGAASKTEKK
ncbi:MAG: small basic protein [Candidatus Omnitrophica bacterium]|nr:small basic protein [Candidatus Omnitrophota bacterium]MBU1869716.1 small basic protein [Candidatus Omnitrophota bacterium]